MKPALIDGMHGLGDNVHQRALVRHLMARDHDIWLKTPWPCLYHDLVGERLHLVDRGTTLRTQAKNAKRERASYSRVLPPFGSSIMRIWYDRNLVLKLGSILGAMFRTTLGYDVAGADFTLPVPPEWRAKAAARFARPDRPIMVLRPLVDRKEWDGCDTRNPDPVAYARLFNAIRSRFFVVSIADLVPHVEWIKGEHLDADVSFHAGELDIEAITGLIASAAVVFCSPGFAIPLAQAVGTSVIAVFGGRESSRFYRYGERFAPTLGIDPVRPCECFLPKHKCDKHIDLSAAHERIARFIEAHCHAAESPAIVVRREADRLDRPANAVHEPGGAGGSDRAGA